MKLTDIYEQDKQKPGTYAGVRFSPSTVESLTQYATDNKIPNALDSKEYHTTLLYSRKHLPNYEPMGEYSTHMTGTPTGFEIWPSQPDDEGHVKNCLVMTYSCPRLYQRHHKLMQQHGATYDFDEYKPHVTLSYDAGDLDPSKLPAYEEEIEITKEYREELTDSWADDKKGKK